MPVDSNFNDSEKDPVRSAIIAACRHLMNPIARFLIKNGVTYKEFSDVAKVAFVQIATDEYGIRKRKTNISRTAVLTGLTRKEVKRVRDALREGGDTVLPEVGRPAQLLSLWIGRKEFVDENGYPRILEYDGPNGFRDLCRLGGGDVPPGALLTELKRAGSISESADGKIHLVKRHFNPSGTDEYQAKRFGECLHDLADTVEFNLDVDNERDRRYEYRVWNENIPRQFAARFQSIVRDQGTSLLEVLDDWLSAHESGSAESADDDENRRCGVGIYFFDGKSPSSS